MNSKSQLINKASAMGKMKMKTKTMKMKFLLSFFKPKESTDRPWLWPLCGYSETPSFNATNEIYRSINSIFFDRTLSDRIETPDSWFTNSSLSESESFSTAESDGDFDVKALELVVRGAKSERLIFEPEESNLIFEKRIEELGDYELIRFEEESVVLAMESEDPYTDFRRSMEEMVESNGIRDWENLEELLNWYLKMNRIKNHGYILGAFVDLLVDIDGGFWDSSSLQM